LFHLHCFEVGAGDIDAFLAFRDFLRRNPEVAQAYAGEKMRCASLHAENPRAYSECKSAWIARTQQAAIRDD
jgi:dephospho-CoA kinase